MQHTYYGRSYGVSPYYQNYYYNGYSNLINWLVMIRMLILIRKALWRLSLVDSKTKNIVWKGTPPTVFKSKMNLKLLQNLWMICSQISEKSLIQQTSSLEIIDFLNRNTKQIIHTKINIMKTNFFTIITMWQHLFSSSVCPSGWTYP
jgi:hypothetical protein